ncbi:SAF domain protein [Streptomyces lavendulae subsp. lavendulae]|uniref:SAF domain protein n=1 Tax=Streptomyces lavendulae subsp. lavendulae TaxID=58340 RepID=A0A2K8P680_STRLA|nr:SAF domain-containing protein [Streptomyces lavendulae]ATZ21968.1 SAF domain protein [Streptomyces lavendulae subsp. lavendulae]ATZ29603.1 SAF domain protein [Streptomyces lavendulae subsp. lavendulae]
MSTTTTPAPGRAADLGTGGACGPGKPAAAPRVVRQRRRRPGLIALSVALIAAGGLSGALLFTASGQRSGVLVVARDVPVGTAITDADLAPASLALDPAVKAVSAARKGEMVGQHAAVALTAGSLLSPAQVSSSSLVKAGEQLVGVALKPSQFPASRLSPGQKVLIVSTPDPVQAAAAAGGKPGEPAGAPKTLAATVVAVGEAAPATGVVTVDVAVPAADGPTLAARVATGAVALIVAAQGGS